MKVIGVIPARYASTRFPGKPLADICGKPMIWWVYNQIKQSSKIDKIIVAVDDNRVEEVCLKYAIPTVLTSDKHLTAVNRICEVSKIIEGDFYIQVNGDEPLINYKYVDKIIPKHAILSKPYAVNLITNIKTPQELMDPSNIKVVFDKYMNIKYMSRAVIPYLNDSLKFTYYKHVGILGYNRMALEMHENTKPENNELVEKIDSLRIIDNNIEFKAIIARNISTLSVDTKKDLEKVIEIFKQRYKYE